MLFAVKKAALPSSLLGAVSGGMRGGSGPEPGFRQFSPISTLVRPERISFRWQLLGGRKSLSVEVTDPEGEPIAGGSAEVAGTTWRPRREQVRAWPRGQDLLWRR